MLQCSEAEFNRSLRNVARTNVTPKDICGKTRDKGEPWLKELLRSNVDINTPDPRVTPAPPSPLPSLTSRVSQWGTTALHFAADRGELQVAKLLVANKADLDLKNNVRPAAPPAVPPPH